MHVQAFNAVVELFSQGNSLHVIPQNLIEFWSVATRPADKNGLGFTVSEADSDVSALESIFTILPDLPAIYSEWRKLVVAHSVQGKQVHDTRIVASMNVHGISELLTFNAADFKRFSNITILDPTSI